MDLSKSAAVSFAHALGFDDTRFVSPDVPLCKTALAANIDAQKEALSVAVLFLTYRATNSVPHGMMALSPYYTASHHAFNAAKDFAAYITSRGGIAQHTTALDAKAAALLSGGFIGDNGFYYHPSLGSLVCIQTVLTNVFLPDSYVNSDTACLHCGKCARACPSGGVKNLQRCVRYHSDSLIPEALRGDVYQLLGCEKCQTSCPLNRQDKQKPHSFSIDSLLEGSCMERLQNLAGKNMARRKRIVSQAALYAANTAHTTSLEHLRILSDSEQEPVRSHAIWAYNKLNGKKEYD